MKTAIFAGWQKAKRALAVCAAVTLCVVAPVLGQEQGQLFVTQEDGYGRLILSFPGLDKLPDYTMRIENGVLSLEFGEQVSVILPDVGTTMPDYLSVARVDPDGRGLRLGLRKAFNFNRIEAGEQLFIDLLPTTWQGMPPALPQDVVDGLAERARLAAIRAERDRKAADVEALKPRADVRIGRNPTFLRVQFDWTVPTTAQYVQDGQSGRIEFEWPVGVDMRDLAADLPPEIAAVDSAVTPDGANVTVQLAEGVTPRFYQNSSRQFVLDIDIAGQGLPTLEADSVVEALKVPASAGPAGEVGGAPNLTALAPETATKVTPFVNVVGSTLRVVFPFEQDTPAAVFRRGDTVWMVFDTTAGITPPAGSEELDALANRFSVVAAGDTQVVRIDLNQDRLASLGSEGMAWVLSLGDMVLTPTEPIQLSRRRDVEGFFEMVANIARPGRVHDFRDPDVGDMLKVVTAYPPARGITRALDYVEFSALRSVHGLVIKPETDRLAMAIDNDLAVISTPGGLTVSALDGPRTLEANPEGTRGSFVDLARLEEPDARAFGLRRDELLVTASEAEGAQRDVARLELAQYYLANQLSYEAIGILRVLRGELQSSDLTRELRLNMAIADTMAYRPKDALAILSGSATAQDADALFWRTIARADSYDFKGARSDGLEAASVANSYPAWARNRFYFAAIRAAVETDDGAMAERLLGDVNFASLNGEEASLYHLMSGRIDEINGRTDEAIDTYGQVIAADIRPTRAEAVYRTLALLDQAGRLDPGKAAQTLAAEALLWRGNPLEADMQRLLAALYFREGDYRQGFEVVKQAVGTYPDGTATNAMRDAAQAEFATLFLDGKADTLGAVEALGLYYDFRHLTPPGRRGDEMIRNLARRLVRVDLLPQATQLLEYQLENRLRGVARTQVATDLAVIYVADRRPQEALRVLNETRLPGLPDSLDRQRRLLEARAMIDLGRDVLALDMLRDLDGRDVSLLRIDAHWKSRRYVEASEMLEALYSAPGQADALGQPERMSVIKAAVGYVMANDTLGLSRLRSKFADRMVTSPEWPMFDYVTGPIQVDSLEFKKVASQVSGVDGLNAFLAAYRQTYGGEDALAPLSASQPDAGLAAL